jgi:hypothetical protein
MARFDCPHESDVVTMVYTGRWPERAPEDLRAHSAACPVCSDVAAVALAIESETAQGDVPSLPSSGTVWWRAQIRARQDAAKEVVRPITAAQALGLAALFGMVGAVFGASAQWFQMAVRWFARGVSAVGESIRIPSLPAMSGDIAGVWAGYWAILLVVAVSLVAAAAVVGWAVREDKN